MNAGRPLPGTPTPMHRWKGAGGLVIAGDSWGDPKGPLVLLLHGGGQTRHAWKNAGERLGTAGYRAVAFDARGHGDSEWAANGDYTQDVMVEDLLSVVAALGDPRPVLVGASMGGGTSLTAVGEDRIDAAALVLVDIAHRVEPDGVAKIRAFMGQKPDGFDSLEEVADAISAYQPHRKRKTNLEGLAKNLRLAANGKYRWHWDPKFHAGIRHVDRRQERMEACARNLSLPTLLVRGGLSDILSEQGAREFLDLCRGAEFVNVTDAGHMVAGDRNDIFANAVIEFLARKMPVGGAPVHPPHKPEPHHEGPPGPITDVP